MIREPQIEAEPIMPHRSGRVVKEPKRYGMYNAFEYTYIVVIDEFNDDPTSYSKAMASSQENLRQKDRLTPKYNRYIQTTFGLS